MGTALQRRLRLAPDALTAHQLLQMAVDMHRVGTAAAAAPGNAKDAASAYGVASVPSARAAGPAELPETVVKPGSAGSNGAAAAVPVPVPAAAAPQPPMPGCTRLVRLLGRALARRVEVLLSHSPAQHHQHQHSIAGCPEGASAAAAAAAALVAVYSASPYRDTQLLRRLVEAVAAQPGAFTVRGRGVAFIIN